MLNSLQLFGYTSGILALLSGFPYIKDIFLQKTKPERASWFIWTVLIVIQFFSQLSKGATDSLWLTGSQAIEITVISLLSLKYGIGGLTKKDYLALLVASVGLLFWYYTKDAAIALFITIGIDAVGGALTVEKTYLHPQSETPLTWVLNLFAGAFATIAVGKLDIVLLAYPLYVVILNICILSAIFLGSRRLARVKVLK